MLFTNLKKSNSNVSINTKIIATSPPKSIKTKIPQNMENETRKIIKTLEEDISYSQAEIKTKTEDNKLKVRERDNLNEQIDQVKYLIIL